MEPIARILLVEDDETIALGVVTALRHERYDVEHCDNGEDGFASIQRDPPDLLLLDVMLPGMDGLTLLRKVKADFEEVQVIMLTARGEEVDRVLGLELGADDYVTKPFSLRELVARVKARLRGRPQTQRPRSGGEEYTFGDLQVDLRRRLVIRKGEEYRLTTHEAWVLAHLINNRGRDVSREELLEQVWGYGTNITTRTVDNQVLKLRKKIEEIPSDPRHILTVHGTGYRFEA